MIIEKMNIGAHGRKTVYAICADVTETGDKLHEITRFDRLETASIVLKYLRGDQISKTDEKAAKEAIKKASAPTDESKRTHKAE